MVSTRSKSAQTHLEVFASVALKEKKPASPEKATLKANTSRKRKSVDFSTTLGNPIPKRIKPSAKASTKPKNEPAADKGSKPIIINRAPVLAGSAVSSICAVAKGRPVGTIPEKDEEANQKANQEGRERAKKQEDLDEIDVMRFKLRVKDGFAVV
ncbi:hypothetical protein BU25DRAFT_462302 [Macroventuria anomochaeta]|uniref:Uncharacterized protein n=1 Tax=Macroventuria anomochaeta TaxID=301207 RepID=A0ACB6RMQ9_9PLEO|nr:uncharacterized protein BU25DRAFT_462302 [Macroventuria anomochaeta]KAF2623161.1 hypothetical protein BU25DRAFT_462302 [Macroventuria anomochaeta]